MNRAAIQTFDHGNVLAVADYAPLLRANGLDTFEKIMAAESDHFARRFPGRNTVRMELKSSDGGATRAIYLKRYEPEYLSSWDFFLRAIRWPNADDESGREWRGLHALRAQGFNTATPIAMGQKKSGGVVTRSFVMTEEIRGGTPGDSYCRGLDTAERRQFFAGLAVLARRFHDAGFAHRDFYLCHFFVVPRERLREIFLIDLQRVFQPRLFRERWLVKDLGSLAYSALNAGATEADVLHFVKTYLGENGSLVLEKRLVVKMLRRVAWLQTRVPEHRLKPTM